MQFPGHHNIERPTGQDHRSWFTYSCAHCGTRGAGAVLASHSTDNRTATWLMCLNCGGAPVLARDGNIHPGTPFGPNIEGLPDDVGAAYKEARNCMSVNAFTACELLCRKILMRIAVEKGAKEGDTFSNYLKHLEKSGYITPPMKGWVDIIRQHGNNATHKISKVTGDGS